MFGRVVLTAPGARLEKTLGATAYVGGGGAGVRSRSPRGGTWLGGLALSKAKNMLDSFRLIIYLSIFR